MKIAIVDLETTGLNPLRGHEIIEIGAVVFDDSDLEKVEEINIKVKPDHPELGDEGAYRVNGYNPTDWENAQSLPEVLKSLEQTFKGAMFMSYNVTFDWSFMAKAYHDTGLWDPFHYHRIDLMTLAWHVLPKGSSISLKNACQMLEIEPEPGVHRALNGAIKGFEVYKKIVTNPTSKV